MWTDVIKKHVPKDKISKILDLGCGTGRFTGVLSAAFKTRMTGIDPSESMVARARSKNLTDVEWKIGSAEKIPAEDGKFDMVFMSNVYHHLDDPDRAFKEIKRVLNKSGFLVIRNGTRENNEEIVCYKCFPEAIEYDNKRIPSVKELKDYVCSHEFDFISQETIYQYFASSYKEYYNKIAQRALSSLVAISDEAFEKGCKKLKEWTDAQPEDRKVNEPLDMFFFNKVE
jgi:ubiquinone/menaquinone biosynthesis C-methylase UbiE